jgi:signal transduction histidine kinase
MGSGTRAGIAPDGDDVAEDAAAADLAARNAYQSVLERLLASDAAGEDGVDTVLDIGLDYFGLDLAVIVRRGRVVERLRGRAAADMDHAEVSALGARLLALPMDGDGATVLSEASAGSFRALVAAPVAPRGAAPGVAAFLSREPVAAFPAQASMVVRLIAHWIADALERADRLSELSRSRAELQVVLEGIPAPVVCLDETGGTLIANAAARTVRRPDLSRLADAAALRSAEPRAHVLESWETADGEPRWMRVDRVPFAEAGTGERRLLVVANDVTEAEEKERALAHANEGLNQFAYIASHDLQEPLRKISTFVDILVEGIASGQPQDVTYSAKVIKDSAQRASALIKDLLSWARLTNRAIDRRPLRLAEAVREIVGDILAARPGEAAEVVDEMTDVVVSADPVHVRQLVENLVANAVKYHQPGRPPRITLRLAKRGGRVIFEVEDNGIGFDPIHADLIFEPFRRLHAEREFSGTGVGLAICARVCERHGWTIEATGRPGEGALFRVDLGRPDRRTAAAAVAPEG